MYFFFHERKYILRKIRNIVAKEKKKESLYDWNKRLNSYTMTLNLKVCYVNRNPTVIAIRHCD